MGDTRNRYLEKIIQCGMVRETIKYFSGRYGARGNGGPKEKPSEDKIVRWQDKRAEDKCRWLINSNFKPGDVFFTGHWAPKVRKTANEVQADVAAFIVELRKAFKKEGKIFRYVFSVGIGERGGIHFHMVMSRMDTEVIQQAWQNIVGTRECPYPSINFKHLDGSCQYRRLAAYIVKNGIESLRSDQPVYKKRYCPSRNLKPPKITVKLVEAKSWRKEPKPHKGYYIDRDSLRTGETIGGYPYQSYAMIRLNI